MKSLLIIACCLVFRGPEKKPVHIVHIEGMSFVPKTLEIKPGETVRWINQSGSLHNVVANDKSFASEMLEGENGSFEYTFTQAGEYAYYCRPHKMMGMKGKIVVVD